MRRCLLSSRQPGGRQTEKHNNQPLLDDQHFNLSRVNDRAAVAFPAASSILCILCVFFLHGWLIVVIGIVFCHTCWNWLKLSHAKQRTIIGRPSA
jgi:hypothetical protein